MWCGVWGFISIPILCQYQWKVPYTYIAMVSKSNYPVNINKSRPDYKNCLFSCGDHKLALRNLEYRLTGTTVMAPRIQVSVKVAFLFCVVTTSMGGITDLHKTVSELETKMKVSREDIKSLHQLIVQLEKRLQPLKAKGEFEIQPTDPTLHAC